MGKNNKINIMIIEDHHLVRQGLRDIFSNKKNYFLYAEASNAEEALNHLAVFEKMPDIIILDISLKGVFDGIELINIIRCLFGNIKIMILSMYDEIAYIEKALHSGVNGYIIKKDPVDILIEGIERIINGECYISSSITGKFKKTRSFSLRIPLSILPNIIFLLL